MSNLTIDELAAETGVPSRTIRFYQARGVLPPPERSGRVALYGQHHVNRLQVIAEMQARGLRLRAIRDLLAEAERGDIAIIEWLGLEEKLKTPWSEDRPHLVTQKELLAKVGGSVALDELERHRWIEPQSGTLPRTYLVRSPGLVDIVVQLRDVGLDVGTATAASSILRRRLARAADELVALFNERVGPAPGRGPEALGRALDALRPLASESVRLIFAQEIERALRDLIDQGASALKGARRRSPARRSGTRAVP